MDHPHVLSKKKLLSFLHYTHLRCAQLYYIVLHYLHLFECRFVGSIISDAIPMVLLLRHACSFKNPVVASVEFTVVSQSAVLKRQSSNDNWGAVLWSVVVVVVVLLCCCRSFVVCVVRVGVWC